MASQWNPRSPLCPPTPHLSFIKASDRFPAFWNGTYALVYARLDRIRPAGRALWSFSCTPLALYQPPTEVSTCFSRLLSPCPHPHWQMSSAYIEMEFWGMSLRDLYLFPSNAYEICPFTLSSVALRRSACDPEQDLLPDGRNALPCHHGKFHSFESDCLRQSLSFPFMLAPCSS
jgi:hypothetical protein